MSKPFTISETARRAGLSVYQVRAYIQMGLITPCGYMSSGYQLFDIQSVGHLRLIASARHIGLLLKDIAPVIEALASGDGDRFSHAYGTLDNLMTERCREIRRLRRKLGRFHAVPPGRWCRPGSQIPTTSRSIVQ